MTTLTNAAKQSLEMKLRGISLLLMPIAAFGIRANCSAVQHAYKQASCCPSSSSPGKVVSAEHTQGFCLDLGSEDTDGAAVYFGPNVDITSAEAIVPLFNSYGMGTFDDKIMMLRRAMKPNVARGFMAATTAELEGIIEGRHPHMLSQNYYATDTDAIKQQACAFTGGMVSRPFEVSDLSWFTLSGGGSGTYSVSCLKERFGLATIHAVMSKMTAVENRDPAVLAGEVKSSLYHMPSMAITQPQPPREICPSPSLRRVGGTLYVASGSSGDGSATWAHQIDLGALAVTADTTNTARCVPGSKPHMVLPSPDGSLVAISYTADDMLHILDADTKRLVGCVDASAFVGKLHTAHWHTVPGDNTWYLLAVDMTGVVDDKGGGGVHKFSVTRDGLVSYVASVSANNAPLDSKPIACGGHQDSKHVYVTDAKGGGFFLDVTTMQITKRVAASDLGKCATSAGLWVYPHPDKPAILVAQYGKQEADSSCLFEIDMSTQTIAREFVLPYEAIDAHGTAFCKNSSGDLFLLNSNRVSGTFDVFEYATGLRLRTNVDLNSFLLPDASPPPSGPTPAPTTATPTSDGGGGGMRRRASTTENGSILQPDVIWYNAQTKIVSFVGRGPSPLSAITNNALAGAQAGLYEYKLDNCLDLYFSSKRPVIQARADKSDPHGGDQVVRQGHATESWMIDQSNSGLSVSCSGAYQTFISYNAMENA